MENGPCVFDDFNDTIFDNPYPWNERTNVLFIEGPAGVGYSYAQTTADKQFNDQIAADDFLKAMNSFYIKFPEFVGRDLYISGESYAGIYVPYLAFRIHQQNQNARVLNQTQINLKGILVGNPATDWWVDVYPSMMEVAYMHNIIDKDLYEGWRDSNCKLYFREIFPTEFVPEC